MKRAKRQKAKMTPEQQRVFDKAAKKLTHLQRLTAQYDSQFGKLYSTEVRCCYKANNTSTS